MTEAYECDRCGEISTGEPHRIVEVREKATHRPTSEVDLCRGCWGDVSNVLESDAE